MRQVLRAGALGRPRGIGWGGRWEWGLGWGIHVNSWLIHVSVWQKLLQYCKVISIQLIKINEKTKVLALKKQTNKQTETVYNAEDLGSIPGWERSPGGGHGNPLQYSCLENLMNRGAWRAIVHAVAKSWK